MGKVLRELFSFDGRSTRLHFWIGQMIITPFQLLFTYSDRSEAYIVGIVGVMIVFIPVLFINIKRFHDLDKSGWFVLLSIIPIAGPIILLVMLGFFRGVNVVDMTNSYGVDPRFKDIPDNDEK